MTADAGLCSACCREHPGGSQASPGSSTCWCNVRQGQPCCCMGLEKCFLLQTGSGSALAASPGLPWRGGQAKAPPSHCCPVELRSAAAALRQDRRPHATPAGSHLCFIISFKLMRRKWEWKKKRRKISVVWRSRASVPRGAYKPGTDG